MARSAAACSHPVSIPRCCLLTFSIYPTLLIAHGLHLSIAHADTSKHQPDTSLAQASSTTGAEDHKKLQIAEEMLFARLSGEQEADYEFRDTFLRGGTFLIGGTWRCHVL